MRKLAIGLLAAVGFAFAVPANAQGFDVYIGPDHPHPHHHWWRHHHHVYEPGCRVIVRHHINRYGERVTVRRRVCG